MNQNLLELARNYFIGSTIRQTGTAFGESESSVSTALRSVVPLVLGGLLARSQQPGGAAELFGLAQQVHSKGLLGDLSGLLSGLAAPTATTTPTANGSLPSRGSDMMHTLLGAGYTPAVAGVSQQAGVRPSTVSNLLSMAVAVVLGLLGRHAAQNNLDASGLESYLGSQRGPIMGALGSLSGGLGDVLPSLATNSVAAPVSNATPVARETSIPMTPVGSSDAAPRAPVTAPRVSEAALSDHQTASPSPAAAATPYPAGGSLATPTSRPPANQPPVRQAAAARPAAPAAVAPRRWPWLLLLLLGLAALFYLLRGRPAQPAATTTTTTAAPNTTQTAPLASGSELTTVQVPNGPALRVGGNSAEAQLSHFLTNKAQAVSANKTQDWISLNQVDFDPGKATLTAESRTQLANLAAILKAFPTATIKLGGHAQDQGPGDANLLRSADCANATRTELLKAGIAPSRVAAEGYGLASPIASNATPKDQARNCRVYMRVTEK